MPDKGASEVYGYHAVTALLTQSPGDVRQMFLLKGRKDQRLKAVQQLLDQNKINPQWVSRKQLDTMVPGNHQGVVAIVTPSAKPKICNEDYLKSRLRQLQEDSTLPFVLILDGITDPHNLGACLRSAAAAGVQLVIVPKDNSAPLTPVAIKVACGAAEAIPLVRVTNLSRTMQWLQQQGLWLLGAAGEAQQRYDQADMTGPLGMVVGSEGKGLRRLVREQCDSLIAIPMEGAVTSLNVSVATGICLFEAVRQRSSP